MKWLPQWDRTIQKRRFVGSCGAVIRGMVIAKSVGGLHALGWRSPAPSRLLKMHATIRLPPAQIGSLVPKLNHPLSGTRLHHPLQTTDHSTGGTSTTRVRPLPANERAELAGAGPSSAGRDQRKRNKAPALDPNDCSEPGADGHDNRLVEHHQHRWISCGWVAGGLQDRAGLSNRILRTPVGFRKPDIKHSGDLSLAVVMVPVGSSGSVAGKVSMKWELPRGSAQENHGTGNEGCGNSSIIADPLRRFQSVAGWRPERLSMPSVMPAPLPIVARTFRWIRQVGSRTKAPDCSMKMLDGAQLIHHHHPG